MKKDYWKRFDTGSGLRGRGLGPVFLINLRKWPEFVETFWLNYRPYCAKVKQSISFLLFYTDVFRI